MGITYVEGIATGPNKKKARLHFLVDSGAMYTLLPERVWRQLKLKPKRTLTFSLADGTTIKRAVSECHIKLADGDGYTTVILGEDGDEPLLGVVTLEQFGLVLHPFKRQLQPMRLLLA